MNQIYESNPREIETMNTSQLRENFLMENLFKSGEANFVYSHYDRMVSGGIIPINGSLSLGNFDELRSDFFLQRREMGVLNTGGSGSIMVDGEKYQLDKLSCLYIPKGKKEVLFESIDNNNPAMFFAFSAPAHHEYEAQLYTKEDALPFTLGSEETANLRTIYKYIHGEGIKSCQVVMGLTVLSPGCVWNTMPAHTHDRRSEVYLYFDVPKDHGVMHFMGQPQETRHLWVRDRQAVISPPWSIHSGSGTTSYSFIWAMAGENQDFGDMDQLTLDDIR